MSQPTLVQTLSHQGSFFVWTEVPVKDRAVDEVVVFVVSHNSTPLGLVATKILRDQIVGYLEVPTEKPAP